MIDTPKTLAEAQAHDYSARRCESSKYAPGQCAYEVWASGRMIDCWQCRRPNGHGPAGLYCKQHARMVEKET